MLKKWLAAAAVCGICLLTPAAVLAGELRDPGRIETEGEEDGAYQAVQQGTNAQGLKIITDPLWEYNDISKRYRLVKSRDAQGRTTYFTLQDGVLQLGRVPGYLYAFDAKGDMITTLQMVDGVRYHFTPRSKAVQDKAEVTPDHTTLGRAVQDRWMRVGRSWYYFNSVGRQDTGKVGLQRIEGAYYHLGKTGTPFKAKWIKESGGAWWYFGKDGQYDSSKIGSRKINGSYYYLGKRGIPYKKVFKKVKNKRYYYGASGERADYTGWKTIDKKKYYFHKKHYIQIKKGWQLIKGKKYYFTSKGRMYAGKWASIGGDQYFFKSNGQMADKWTKINGVYHCFTSSGRLERSTVAKQGKHYYLVTPQGTRGSNILDAVGVDDAMDNGTKLRRCFDYVVRNCRYVGGVVWPPKGWEPYHAYKMLTTRLGNCYDFAAAFCYLAKAAGFEGMRCIAGQCASAGGGYTPHSWCEFNGMVFDPEISYANGYYLFNVPYGGLPFAYIR